MKSENLSEPLNIPLKITVDIPEIQVFSAKKSTGGKEVVSVSLCCPPPTIRSFDLSFKTTASKSVDIFAFSGKSFFYGRDKDEVLIPDSFISLVPLLPEGESIMVPPDTTSSLSYEIRAQQGRDLSPGVYNTQVVLSGDGVRSKTIDIQFEIPQSFYWIWGIRIAGSMIGILMLLWAILSGISLWNGVDHSRRRFRGDRLFDSMRDGGIMQSRSFNIHYDQSDLNWIFQPSQRTTYSSVTEGEMTINSGDTINMENGDYFTIDDSVIRTGIYSGDSRDELMLRLGRSRFSRISLAVLPFLLAAGMVIIFLCALHSPWLCNILTSSFPVKFLI